MKISLNCDTAEAVRLILCWYFLHKRPVNVVNYDDFDTYIKAVYLSNKFVTGKTKQFSQDEFSLFYEALGAYPDRDETLEELYTRAKKGLGILDDH